jgi:hypothetical protein
MGTYLKPGADGRRQRPSSQPSTVTPAQRWARRAIPVLIVGAILVAIVLATVGR